VQIFLIRHTRPLIEEGVCYGQLDLDVDSQAQDLQACATHLRSVLPTDTPVVASPLQRTRRLAEALHAAPCFDDRLMEINFGAWEGRRWDDIPRNQLDAWAADVLHFAPSAGESVAMLQARAMACAATFSGEQIAVVTHGGVIRALLGHWLQLPLAEWSQMQLAFGGVSLVELHTDSTAPNAVLHYQNR
jgi:alpha-ribazole phosphatase